MKIGLALSGGGVRGVSHLGVIKALAENSIPISHISGTSSGGIAGVFYAAGLSPEKILEIIVKVKPTNFVRPGLLGYGLLKTDPIQNLFEKHLPVRNFEELSIPVTVSITRLKDATTCYYSSGPIARILTAASAVPVVFSPVRIEGVDYVDGGIVNNLPVEPLADCDKVIGSLCNPIDENFDAKNIRSMLERTLLIAVNTNTYSRREKCDIILEPGGLKKMKVFSMSKAEEIFRIGYEFTLERIPEIKNRLSLDH